MDKVCILLSKENIQLSLLETKTILKSITSSFKLDNNLLILNITSSKNIVKLLNKLAYAKEAFILINESKNKKELYKSLESKKLEFSRFTKYTKINKAFRITTKSLTSTKSSFDITKLAKIIYEKGIEKISMNPPSMNFYAFQAKKTYFCLKFWENTEKYTERKNDKRPAPHPTSMNPKLARVMVNLANPSKEVLDPFCGSGGILIEAGLEGLKCTGIDIYKPMIERAKINLKYYKIKKFKLITADALTWKNKIECVVTDVPYGKSSKLKGELQKLVDKFLNKYKKLTKTIVLACPSDIKIKHWKIKEKHNIYIHSTLTRSIYVLK